MKLGEVYTFDDVLIKPQYSEIKSRAEIDLSVKLSKGFSFHIPIMPANMKTIISPNVATELYELGGMCLLHRFSDIEEQVDMLKYLKNRLPNAFNYIGVSIGVKEEDYKNIGSFHELGVKIVCIDVAHGESLNCVQIINYISKKYPNILLIAGNVATGNGALRLWEAGADACKIGVGSGSTCLTRTTTGVGIPQLSALIDVYNARKHHSRYTSDLKNKFIIADGGCSKVGDLVKSLALSDMVMTGNLFSGATETPGEIIELDGRKYKRYDGSSTHRGGDYIEGVHALVECKGSIKSIIKTMLEGIASGCSYTGSKNLQELKENTTFIKITNAGIKENGAHDVRVIK
jgi:IMP dehydrogenase